MTPMNDFLIKISSLERSEKFYNSIIIIIIIHVPVSWLSSCKQFSAIEYSQRFAIYPAAKSWVFLSNRPQRSPLPIILHPTLPQFPLSSSNYRFVFALLLTFHVNIVIWHAIYCDSFILQRLLQDFLLYHFVTNLFLMATSIIFHQKSAFHFVHLLTQQWPLGFFFFSIIRNDISGGPVLVSVCLYLFSGFWSMSWSEKHVFKFFTHFNLLSTSSWYLQMIQDKGWNYFLEMVLSSCPIPVDWLLWWHVSTSLSKTSLHQPLISPCNFTHSCVYLRISCS